MFQKHFRFTIKVYGKKLYIGPYQTQSNCNPATNQPSISIHSKIVKVE